LQHYNWDVLGNEEKRCGIRLGCLLRCVPGCQGLRIGWPISDEGQHRLARRDSSVAESVDFFVGLG
jgi:hypothetical protein